MNILIGASSTIASSVRDILLSRDESVVCISRSTVNISHPNLQSFKCDYSEAQIDAVIQSLVDTDITISRVVIFLGILHNPDNMPEKKLEDWSPDFAQHVHYVNALLPMLWISKLTPILASKKQRELDRVSIMALSARVGSIEDNRLGGWYSYRSSKAALNMSLQTAAIELARRALNTKLIAFHPGTTDTALSKPFQANVRKDKLFTPDFVASRLLNIIDQAPLDGALSYLDWDNKVIPW